jgi:hypothetical protein
MSWRGKVCAIGGPLLFFLGCGSSSRPADETGLGGSGGNVKNESGVSTSGSGSAGSASSAGATKGVSGTAGARPTGDAGSGGSSDESGSAGAAGQEQGSPTSAGAVYVGVAADSAGSYASIASAHFALPIEQPNCMTQTFGDCRVTTCDPSASPRTKADAGLITVNFADQFSAELGPTSDGYYVEHWIQQLVSPGDAISVTAAGDEIPAFSSSIVQPVALRLTAPAADVYGWVAVHRDADLELTFTGGTSGVRLGAESQGSYSGGGWFSVRCSFASQAGRALISKPVLSYAAGILSLYTYRAKTVPAGEYAIDLEARGVVLDSEGLKNVNLATY